MGKGYPSPTPARPHDPRAAARGERGRPRSARPAPVHLPIAIPAARGGTTAPGPEPDPRPGGPRAGNPPRPSLSPRGRFLTRTAPGRVAVRPLRRIAPMSALPLPAAALTAAHCDFEAALPKMKKVYTYQFRRTPARHRGEAIAEAL